MRCGRKAKLRVPAPRGGQSSAFARQGIRHGANLLPRWLKVAENCVYNPGLREMSAKNHTMALAGAEMLRMLNQAAGR
jgi:hypothetical protein